MMRIQNYLTYVLVFLLPWQTRLILRSGELNGGYWEYGTISLYFTELMVWTALLLWTVSTVRTSNFQFPISNFQSILNFKFLIFKNRFVNYYLLLTTYYLLIGLVVLRSDLHYYYLLRILEGFALYCLIKSVDARRAAWAFVLGMLPQALLGIYQFLTQSSFGSSWLGMAAHDPANLGTFVVETVSGRWLRAYGGLPHPNILGGYLVITIMLLLNSSFHSRSKRFQISNFRLQKFLLLTTYYLLLTIFTAALFLTFSRSAWLTLFVALVVYFIITIRSRSLPYCNGIRIIFGIVFAIVLTFFIFGSIFKEPLLSRAYADNRLETKSKIERIMGYEEAWKLFRKHPLVGVGLDNYTYAVYKEIDGSRQSFAYQPVHNIFVLLIVEGGILGILAIFSLFMYWFLKARSTVLIFTTLFVIVLGLFDHYLVSLYSGIVLIVAVSVMLGRQNDQVS